jgi:hypothetical protein
MNCMYSVMCERKMTAFSTVSFRMENDNTKSVRLFLFQKTITLLSHKEQAIIKESSALIVMADDNVNQWKFMLRPV